MTAIDAQLELRPPVWARAWAVVFPVLFAGFLLVVLRPEGPVRLIAPGMAIACALLGWRLFRTSAVGTAAGVLLVRNHWRDRTVTRAEVADVEVARDRGSSARCVTLRLRDGSSLRLEVTETPFAGPFRARLERQAGQVRDWVAGAPRPYL